MAEEKEQVDILAKAIREVFGEDKSRFVDVSRVPFLCASVININKTLTEMNEKIDEKFVTKDSFIPVQKIVYGMVAVILTAFLGLVIYFIGWKA